MSKKINKIHLLCTMNESTTKVFVFFLPFSTLHMLYSSNVDKQMENKEAVVQRCSVKKVFLEISQKSQENTCARVSFLTKL